MSVLSPKLKDELLNYYFFFYKLLSIVSAMARGACFLDNLVSNNRFKSYRHATNPPSFTQTAYNQSSLFHTDNLFDFVQSTYSIVNTMKSKNANYEEKFNRNIDVLGHSYFTRLQNWHDHCANILRSAGKLIIPRALKYFSAIIWCTWQRAKIKTSRCDL